MTPNEWFDGRSRILFVHAHPDDETIATGGTLAALAEAGRDPAVLTLTRGERGEVVEGALRYLQGTAGLASHREHELRAALTALGVTRHRFLGSSRVYEDSGMVWADDGLAAPAPDVPKAALTRAPAVDVINDAVRAALELDGQGIVSYDAQGGYGHPDHVLAHRVARSVATALDIPFWEITTDGEGERYDVEPWLGRKMMALRMYATQLTVSGEREITHVGGQRQPVEAIESYRQLAAPVLSSLRGEA